MPELPEITILAEQMGRELPRHVIDRVVITQPKCLNVDPVEMAKALEGTSVIGVRPHGKWIVSDLSSGSHLLLNLGMGGDVLYYASLAERTAADKIAVEVAFRDGGGVTIRFWWFGHVHLAAAGALGDHKPSAGIGPSPLSDAFTPGYLAGLCEGRRTAIKTVILDQRLLGGIGNVYGQDPLFHARIHPLQPARSLTSGEIAALHSAIRTVLTDSLRAGGLAYERDLYGKSGGYGPDRFAVAYREGKPCPACGNPIVKLKTGSTSTHICERCQVLRA